MIEGTRWTLFTTGANEELVILFAISASVCVETVIATFWASNTHFAIVVSSRRTVKDAFRLVPNKVQGTLLATESVTAQFTVLHALFTLPHSRQKQSIRTFAYSLTFEFRWGMARSTKVKLVLASSTPSRTRSAIQRTGDFLQDSVVRTNT